VDRDDRVGSARLTLPRVVLPTVRVPREDQELNQSSRIATPRRRGVRIDLRTASIDGAKAPLWVDTVEKGVALIGEQ
jgi:hypothetical protein